MKKLSIVLLMFFAIASYGQIDRDQLSLDISKANAANMEQLKAFIWKKHSTVTIDGEQKADLLNEISIGEDNKVNVTNLDASTTVKKKRGIRGKIQQSTAQNNSEYLQGAIEHALAYVYMSKGEMLDFFSKAEITDKDGSITATAADVLVKGDKLTIVADNSTKLFISQEFSSSMGDDPISGKVNYDKFKSGIVHVTTSTLNLPAKKAIINSTNKDYVQKVM